MPIDPKWKLFSLEIGSSYSKIMMKETIIKSEAKYFRVTTFQLLHISDNLRKYLHFKYCYNLIYFYESVHLHFKTIFVISKYSLLVNILNWIFFLSFNYFLSSC